MGTPVYLRICRESFQTFMDAGAHSRFLVEVPAGTKNHDLHSLVKKATPTAKKKNGSTSPRPQAARTYASNTKKVRSAPTDNLFKSVTLLKTHRATARAGLQRTLAGTGNLNAVGA